MLIRLNPISIRSEIGQLSLTLVCLVYHKELSCFCFLGSSRLTLLGMFNGGRSTQAEKRRLIAV